MELLRHSVRQSNRRKRIMKFLKHSILIAVFFIISLSVQGQSNNSVGPLIQNDWTTFTWPYNAYYPESSNGVNGHIGNACGHTAIARILHYYGYPVNGTQVLDFTTYFGDDWYCELTNLNLNYTAMPYQLAWDAPESKYEETAKLFLAAGAVGEKIEIGFRDAHLKLPGAMEEYFNFSADATILNRWEISREEWIEIFKFELDNGRPILVVGRTPDSPAPWEQGSWQGHWWICDGYNSNDEFYVNYSFGGIKGYYDIDNLGGIYTAYNTIIVGLEPDLGGQSIAVISPLKDDVFSLEDEINISWQSSSVANVDIHYSFDGGWTWQELANDISASSGSYVWSPSDDASQECLIKVTDASDENIYSNSGMFSIQDPSLLPDAAFNPSPANNDVNVSINPVLSWTNSENTNKITLLFGESNPPTIKLRENMLVEHYNVPTNALDPEKTYYWQVISKNDFGETKGQIWSFTTGTTTSVDDDAYGLPTEFELHQNFPNPFNPSTTIYYSIPKESHVVLKIYDLLGKEVEELISERQLSGKYQLQFDGSNLNSGIYFCVMTADEFTSTIKLVLTK